MSTETKPRAASSRASQIALTPRSALPVHVLSCNQQLAQLDAAVAMSYDADSSRRIHRRPQPAEFHHRQNLSSAKTTASTARGVTSVAALPPISVRETIQAPPSVIVSATSRRAVTDPHSGPSKGVAPHDWKFLSAVDIDVAPVMPTRLLRKAKGQSGMETSTVPSLPLIHVPVAAKADLESSLLQHTAKRRKQQRKVAPVPNESFQASGSLPQIVTAVPPPSCKAIPESYPDPDALQHAKEFLAERLEEAAAALVSKRDVHSRAEKPSTTAGTSATASASLSPRESPRPPLHDPLHAASQDATTHRNGDGEATKGRSTKRRGRRGGSPLRGYATLRHNPPLVDGVPLARLGGFLDHQPVIEEYLDEFQRTNPPGTAGSALDFDASNSMNNSTAARRRPKRSTDLGVSLAEQLQRMADMCTVVLVGFAPLAPDEPGYEEESLDMRVKLRSQYRGLHPVEHVKLASDLPTDLKLSIVTAGKGTSASLVKVEYEGSNNANATRSNAQPFYVQPRALDYVAVRAGQWSGALPTDPEGRLQYLRDRQKEAMAYFGFVPKTVPHKPHAVLVSPV